MNWMRNGVVCSAISLRSFLSTFIVTICYERQSGFQRRTPF